MVDLDYEKTKPRPGRNTRIAASMNRITWMVCGLSILGIAAVVLFTPRKSMDPYAHVFQEFSDYGPAINAIGGAFGMAGAILGNRWSVVAVLLHVVLSVTWPSIGFA